MFKRAWTGPARRSRGVRVRLCTSIEPNFRDEITNLAVK